MAHTSSITMLGRLSGVDNWSDAGIWYDPLHPLTAPGVPVASSSLNINLDVTSTDDIGTAQKPLRTNDVIGVSNGLGQPPNLTVMGFLHAHSIQNLAALGVGETGGHATVDGNLKNVGWVNVYEQGNLNVKGDLVNVPQVTITTGSTMELGGSAAGTDFEFGIGPSKLILDHPGGKSFQNVIGFGPDSTLELGHMQFDGAAFALKTGSEFSGSLTLTNHGKAAYTLANVTETPRSGFGFTVGHDRATGMDTVSFHSL